MKVNDCFFPIISDFGTSKLATKEVVNTDIHYVALILKKLNQAFSQKISSLTDKKLIASANRLLKIINSFNLEADRIDDLLKQMKMLFADMRENGVDATETILNRLITLVKDPDLIEASSPKPIAFASALHKFGALPKKEEKKSVTHGKRKAKEAPKSACFQDKRNRVALPIILSS